MIKKSIVSVIAVISFMSFGAVPSARAFIDPASLSIILGATMVTLVAGSEHNQHVKEEHAKAQQKESTKQNQTTEHKEKVDQVSSLTN